MKILCVSHYYPPHMGGLEVVAKKEAESLVALGHYVTVATCVSTGTKRGYSLEDNVAVYRERALNFFERRLSIPFPIIGVGMFLRLRKEVRGCDVVQLHDVFYLTSWFAYFFARLYKKPIILTQHVGIVDHPSKIVTLLQNIVYTLFGDYIFKYAQKIIVYNTNVNSFLQHRNISIDKIVEVRNGIDIDMFTANKSTKSELRKKYGLPETLPLVLFIGRMVSKKGYDILFSARSKEYGILFVGPGEIPSDWRKEKNIFFLGPKERSQLFELYKLADMFVFPATGEIFTLVMQEAMACGLPVITTDDIGYKNSNLDRKKILLCKRTSLDLKENILKIINDSNLQTKMTEYSHAYACEYFNWDKNFKPIADIFTSLKNPRIVTTSWDDGHKLDLRLLNLLKQYGVGATFYIAPHNRESMPQERLTESEICMIASDFEVGAHTMTHINLTDISLSDARNEIIDSKNYLERVTGQPVTSFCYPRGKYKKEHTQLVRESGFVLARTTKRFALTLNRNLFELTTSVHTYDHFLDILGVLNFVKWNPFIFFHYYRKWDVLAMAMFDKMINDGGVFHLWGHSWEIEQHKDWQRLENVLKHISNRKNVYYLSNGQLSDY